MDDAVQKGILWLTMRRFAVSTAHLIGPLAAAAAAATAPLLFATSEVSYCDALPAAPSSSSKTHAPSSSPLSSSSSSVITGSCVPSLGSRATYPANNPTEDRDVLLLDRAEGYRVAVVFDGHGGWNVSNYASTALPPGVLKKLAALRSDADDGAVDAAVRAAFQDVEAAYVAGVEDVYSRGAGAVAKVGSCVGMVLAKGGRLTVANAGDCRTVLGSADHGAYYATRLSRDHNARVPLEVVLLQRQHPGEEADVVRCHRDNPSACYVKGRLQLTRSLGDLYLKYPRFNAKEGQPRSMGRRIPDPYTPPYVSHLPDMTHVRLDPTRDKFVIVASDGVWDFLSDEEAVAVVGRCLDESGGSADAAAAALVEATLRRAAVECGLTYEQLLALPPGKHRRSRHDDTTAVVMMLN